MKKCNPAQYLAQIKPRNSFYKIPNLLIQSSVIMLKRTTVKRTLVPIFSVK